jgi:hypothetical protein
MRKCFVRVGHAMRVILLLDCIAAIVSGIHYFAREAIGHCLFATAACVGNNPPDGQTITA